MGLIGWYHQATILKCATLSRANSSKLYVTVPGGSPYRGLPHRDLRIGVGVQDPAWAQAVYGAQVPSQKACYFLQCGENPHRMTVHLQAPERSVVFHLVLVTLAGDEIQLPIELQEFDRFNEFENAVLENLPQIGKHSTFGCELEFVSARTRKILVDPIWDTLQECNCFNLIVRQCFTQAEHKGQLRQRVKAISVPSDDNDRVLPHAFSHVSDIRHVMVETGVHTIGEAAWQSCQRLQIVKPADHSCLPT